MAAMRPADVLRTTALISEESSGYPFSDPGGWVDFIQILSQLVSRRQEFADARTVYLIVESRLPIKLITGQPSSLGGLLGNRFSGHTKRKPD